MITDYSQFIDILYESVKTPRTNLGPTSDFAKRNDTKEKIYYMSEDDKLFNGDIDLLLDEFTDFLNKHNDIKKHQFVQYLGANQTDDFLGFLQKNITSQEDIVKAIISSADDIDVNNRFICLTLNPNYGWKIITNDSLVDLIEDIFTVKEIDTFFDFLIQESKNKDNYIEKINHYEIEK